MFARRYRYRDRTSTPIGGAVVGQSPGGAGANAPVPDARPVGVCATCGTAPPQSPVVVDAAVLTDAARALAGLLLALIPAAAPAAAEDEPGSTREVSGGR